VFCSLGGATGGQKNLSMQTQERANRELIGIRIGKKSKKKEEGSGQKGDKDSGKGEKRISTVSKPFTVPMTT